ncbi:hypothetical protein L1049_022801 [Liquidambar formosana]|uniref:Transmembrane protein n=1 Tax=Liquidambar formosana TaxID=63359 RepID=A0AAP0RDJ5_LIQFO
MSERVDEFSRESCCLFPLINTLLDSFKIFLRNFRIFLSIFALTTLPLSLLLFSLSLHSHPIQSQIYHLESLAFSSSTRFEARHVWKESRADAVSLLRIKALFSIPCYVLSLLSVITAVNSTALAFHGRRPSFSTAVLAVKTAWKRPFVTSLYVYSLMMAYAAVLRTLAAAFVGAPVPRLVVAVVGAVLEIHLMAVLSMGLVVSVNEDRFGLEAIRIGSGLMEGRRVSGWVLSCLLVLVSGCIGWELEGLMDGQELLGKWYSWAPTVMMGVLSFGDKVGLVCMYALVALWSFVVSTVFYCECRKRHPIGSENEPIPV